MNSSKKLSLILADDDQDDYLLFLEALKELTADVHLTWISDGVKLLQLLSGNKSVPDIVFLDLNMPRKNGLDCLKEMKESEKLSRIPVIIYSTSADQKAIDQLYAGGAHLYIQKPTEFSKLKEVISAALSQSELNLSQRPEKDKFLIKP